MGAEVIAALISAIVGLVGTGVSVAANKSQQDRTLSYNEDQNELARKYDDPAAKAARLRAAGISPALAGLDNAGEAFPSSIAPIDQGSSIMQGVTGLQDAISGYSSQRLDRDRFELDKDEQLFNQRIKKLVTDKQLVQFDDKHLLDLKSMQKMDNDAFADVIKNSSDLTQMAFNAAVTGRMPEGLPDDIQAKFDKAYNAVDRSTTEFQLAKALMDADLSESELKDYQNKANKLFYESNPLDDQLRFNLHVSQAQQLLSNRRLAQQIDYDDSANPMRLSSLSTDTNNKADMRQDRLNALSTLYTDLQEIQLKLNSMGWLRSHGPYASVLRAEERRIMSMIDRLQIGDVRNRKVIFPYFSEVFQDDRGSGGSGVLGLVTKIISLAK